MKNIYLTKVVAFHLESKFRGKSVKKSLNEWGNKSKHVEQIWRIILKNNLLYSAYFSLKIENFSLSLRSYKKIYLNSNEVKV